MRVHRLQAILVAVAACGSPGPQHLFEDAGSVDAIDDAAVDASLPCLRTITETFTAYPAARSGSILGSGGYCNAWRCQAQAQSSFEEQIIVLSNLTPDTQYVVAALSPERFVSFYVATVLDDQGAPGGACLADENVVRNYPTIDTFVAPPSGTAYLVMEAGPFDDYDTGIYSVRVYERECDFGLACATSALPACDPYTKTCRECGGGTSCSTASEPACDATGSCVAGFQLCTGDDVRDDGIGDDGPAAATPIAIPSVGSPTVIQGGICQEPQSEQDWFQIDLSSPLKLTFVLEYSTTDDVAFALSTASYTNRTFPSDTWSFNTAGRKRRTYDLQPGLYWLNVMLFWPMAIDARPYTLRAIAAECIDPFGCTTAARPACDRDTQCVAGPAACIGDDVSDVTPGDDGPAAAENLTGPVGTPQTTTAAVCNSPVDEADFYRVDVAAGEGLVANLAFASSVDLDIDVLDATGTLVGASKLRNPEIVTLTYLPAGAYYVRVRLAGTETTSAAGYTLSVTRTSAQTCTSVQDCAAEYVTQVFRGSCTAGVCVPIPAGTRSTGATCDSADDCSSSFCTHKPYQVNAHLSTCSTNCFGTCSTGFVCVGYNPNPPIPTAGRCEPLCTSDLECGGGGPAPPDPGLPWNYRTCDTTRGICL
jgi:hypothetical protein